MNKKISEIRKLMKKFKIQAYLIPSTDPHQSEYVPGIWKRREWVSGFTGSAGELVITAKDAGLWTDSRYFLQAEEQLKGSDIQLFKIGLPDTPGIPGWLKIQLKSGESVGIDPRLISHQQAYDIQSDLQKSKIHLKSLETNLVDEIWRDQPSFPMSILRPHPLKYSGIPHQNKISDLQMEIKKENCTGLVLTSLDAIAWLFNIRGKDIPFNPLIISYAIVTQKNTTLFIHPQKLDRAATKHLKSHIKIKDYRDFPRFLQKYFGKKDKVWIDPGTVSWWITQQLDKKCELFLKENPVSRIKAPKNSTEIKGLKNAHIRDGVAMVQFLRWLENAVGREEVSELSTAEVLENFRRKQELYQGPSFDTISAYQGHAAIVHYSATPETDVLLNPEGIYLIDSGGQYLDGTTDITRTLALGKPSQLQKELFTRVLKGHIQLAMTRFPKGTAGNQLDTIARKPLWDLGLNYGHGTGHGIGSYLNVHEGPHAISYYRGIGVTLEPGMLISNEPGYYRTGEFGIRIENLILTITDQYSSPDGLDFLAFETVTLCPIQLRLIEKS
ncbi:MAG: aminopeptidase P family N-terminal domain-containing protein, partial [bacterium]